MHMAEKNKGGAQATQTRDTKTEGLPDIAAEAKGSWAPIHLSMVVLILGTLVWASYSYFSGNTEVQPIPLDEHYTVETSQAVKPSLQKNIPLPNTKSVSVAEKEPPISTEIEQQYLLRLEQERQARLQAPVLVANQNSAASGSVATHLSEHPNSEATLKQESNHHTPEIKKAQFIGNRATGLSEGALIHGVLETAINSDLPGLLRAIVSENVYSEDGTRILIERGSRLIGEYRARPSEGQTRIFVIWTTLIQPSGSRVALNSGGTDSLGVAGMQADDIDRHFWERFGTSGLLSLIGAGTSTVGVSSQSNFNVSQAYRQALSASFAQSARESVGQQSAIAPTLRIHQGTPMIVFVAHPLDLTAVVMRAKKPQHIF